MLFKVIIKACAELYRRLYIVLVIELYREKSN